MLLNSPQYLCQEYNQSISPISPLYKLEQVPRNFHLTSNKSFLFSDVQNNKTFIKQFQIETNPDSQQIYKNHPQEHHSQTYLGSEQNDPNQILTIDQIDGVFTTHAFTDQSVLFLNRAGDFYYYNLLNKNVFIADKQHPGLYSDAEILTLQGYFLTCGGCVKNPITNQSQRIIKLWKINQQSDTLQLQTRINTAHSKAIENSFLLNNKVISLSCDKTIRISNLSTQSVQKVIQVNQDLFAGCNIDYNTIIVGGIGRQLKIYDSRTSKIMQRPLNIPSELIQVTKIIRFNDNHLLLSNINELFTLDLRTMRLLQKGKSEGERISQITVINKQLFVVGNRQKTFQIWRAF